MMELNGGMERQPDNETIRWGAMGTFDFAAVGQRCRGSGVGALMVVEKVSRKKGGGVAYGKRGRHGRA